MKDIVLIADHPTTEKRLDRLLNLIQLIKDDGKKIALTSHVLIPEYIVNKCDYFLYDKENPYNLFVENERSPRQDLYMGNYIFTSFEFLIPHKNKDYRFSCEKQFLLALNYLYNLNFDIIHYIEGDVLIDLNELNDNNKIISTNEFDSVIYCSSILMCGGFFSLSIKNTNIDKYLPITNMLNNQISESLFNEEFNKDKILKNHFVKNFSDYNFLNGLSSQLDNKRLRHSFFNIDGKWNLLLWNPDTKSIKIKLVSNIKNINDSFELEPTLTRLYPIDNLSKDDKVYLFINDSLYKEYNLDPSMSEFKYNKVRIT